jgi:hypothetical protein
LNKQDAPTAFKTIDFEMLFSREMYCQTSLFFKGKKLKNQEKRL